MLRLRRPSDMCSRTVSDTANTRIHERTQCVSAEEKILCRSPISQRSHVGNLRQTLQGKGEKIRGWKPQVSTLLCPRRVGALPAEVQRKPPRPLGANTLTQFAHPAGSVQRKRLPPGKGEPPARFRSPRSAGAEKRKEQTFNHLLSGNSILAELLLLCACSLRLLAALYARAFIMLTLAELGKRTRLGTRTLEATQCAVNRLIFLDADLRHSFPSLRTFPSWGSLSTVCIHPYTKP